MFDTFTAPPHTYKIPPQSRLQKLTLAAYRLFWLTADLYLFSAVVYFVARFAVGEGFWYVLLLSSFLQWFLLPALVLLPLALLWRDWWQVSFFTPLVMAFVILYGVFFMPSRGQTAPEDAQTLKLVSFNIASGAVRADELTTFIRSTDADVIGLVEVSRRQVEAIQANLSQDYPYQLLNGERIRGKGLLSRYPIVEAEWVRTRSHGPYIRAVVDVNGQLMTVWVIHLARPEPNRSLTRLLEEDPAAAADLQTVIDRLDSREPTLVMGDFNATDQSRFHDWMEEAGFSDSFREVGSGFGLTFPDTALPFALIRIDFVWTSPQVQPLTAQVGEEGFGSDHLPLMVEVALEVR